MKIDTTALARSSLVLAPLVLVAAWSANSDWLLAAIVTISAYIAMDRSGLAPLGVVLHGLAIAVGFIGLLAALETRPLFVLGCAAIAATSVLLPGAGPNCSRSAFSLSFRPYTLPAKSGKGPHRTSLRDMVLPSYRSWWMH